MSHAPHTGGPASHGPAVRSEEDRVPVVRLVLVGLGALLIFFVGSWITVGYLRARQAAYGPPAVPPDMGQSKIGLVEQQVFELAVRGERARAKQLDRLGSTGWVDKSAGIAHIPIDEAMRLVASGVRAGPTQGGAPPPGGQP